VKRFHPDINAGDARAAQRTKDIIRAYQTLGEPEARSAYDIEFARQRGEARRRFLRSMGAGVAASLIMAALLFPFLTKRDPAIFRDRTGASALPTDAERIEPKSPSSPTQAYRTPPEDKMRRSSLYGEDRAAGNRAAQPLPREEQAGSGNPVMAMPNEVQRPAETSCLAPNPPSFQALRSPGPSLQRGWPTGTRAWASRSDIRRTSSSRAREPTATTACWPPGTAGPCCASSPRPTASPPRSRNTAGRSSHRDTRTRGSITRRSARTGSFSPAALPRRCSTSASPSPATVARSTAGFSSIRWRSGRISMRSSKRSIAAIATLRDDAGKASHRRHGRHATARAVLRAARSERLRDTA
jgi:curved DNA-binding protein CbpA